MSSGCGDVLSLQDLQTAKKHQLFEAEVITGKQGGVATGADIDYATNQATGQTQKTLPATLRDAGFRPASFNFTTGGTLATTDADKVVYDPVSKAWYSWGGTLPKVIPAGTNPLLDPLWKPQTDPNLRDDLAATTGAGIVKTTDGRTVQAHFDALESVTGFNAVGRFLNVTTLRANTPSTARIVVFVASAYSSSATETHYGGGFFESFDNATLNLPDDGGIVIKPATGAIAWRRINYGELQMVYWGVKPDGNTATASANAAAITRAMNYARTYKAAIHAPVGIVYTTEALPIWTEVTIQGSGRAISRFIKTTNNAYTVAAGVSVDALCVCLPDVYNPSGFTMDTFCMRPRIRGISLERQNPTNANKAAYGIWGSKIAQCHFSDMLVLGGNYGFYAINVFLMVQEQVSYSGSIGSFAGVYVANTAGGTYIRTGTTCLFTQVGVGGYNYGFFLAGLDSSRLAQCDTEAIAKITGESTAVAYNWINPMNCSMANCYTEEVDGIMVRASTAATVSIINSLVIESLNITPDGKTFSQPTPLIYVDSAGLGALNVTIIGGDIRYTSIGAQNMVPSVCSGASAVVKMLGVTTNPWNATGGGVVTEL